MSSPTQRTKALLKKQGWRQVAVVERWNQFAGVRQDVFGFIDILAVAPGCVLGVQTTTRENVNKRLAKMLALPALRDCLEANMMVVIHGWSLKGKKGKRKLWHVYERVVTLADLRLEEP